MSVISYVFSVLFIQHTIAAHTEEACAVFGQQIIFTHEMFVTNDTLMGHMVQAIICLMM